MLAAAGRSPFVTLKRLVPVTCNDKSSHHEIIKQTLLSSLVMFNVFINDQNAIHKDHTLITALRQCWTVSSCQNFSSYLDYEHHPWSNQAFSFEHFYSGSTSFYLSSYSLSPQPVIPNKLIPNHSERYTPHAHTILVIHGLPSLPRTPLPNSSTALQSIAYPSISHYTSISTLYSLPFPIFLHHSHLLHMSRCRTPTLWTQALYSCTFGKSFTRWLTF